VGPLPFREPMFSLADTDRPPVHFVAAPSVLLKGSK